MNSFLQSLQKLSINFSIAVSNKNGAGKSITVYFTGKLVSHLILGNRFSDAGNLECSRGPYLVRGPQVPHHCHTRINYGRVP